MNIARSCEDLALANASIILPGDHETIGIADVIATIRDEDDLCTYLDGFRASPEVLVMSEVDTSSREMTHKESNTNKSSGCFGQPLLTVLEEERVSVPNILRLCCTIIEEHGLAAEVVSLFTVSH